MTIATTGDERMLVEPFRDDTVLLAVDDPRFGRIATVRLDADQAHELAAALLRNSGLAPEFQLPT